MQNALLKLAAAAALALACACSSSDNKAVAVQSVTLSEGSLLMSFGNTAKLTATVAPENAPKDIEWTVTGTGATVTGTGLEATVTAGSSPAVCTVTAAAKSDATKFGTCTVTVTAPAPVTGVTVNPTSLSLARSATGTVTAAVQPANAGNKNVTWSSRNTAVATVTNTGATTTVTGVSEGNAEIVATTVEGSYTAVCIVSVSTTNVPPTGVSVAPTTTNVQVNATVNVTATVQPANATNKNVTWSANNANVTLTPNGSTCAVRGVTAGSSTVTAKTVEGNFQSSCTVTVQPTTETPVRSVGVQPTSIAALYVGDSATLTASVLPIGATNRTVTWSVTAGTAANVVLTPNNLSCTVRGVSAGSVTVTATSNADSTKSGNCVVNVAAAPVHNVYVGGEFGMTQYNGTAWSAQSAYNGSTVYDIFVTGAGVVHACGYTDLEASVWNNGTRSTLPRTAGTSWAEARAMVVDGSNVYVCGVEYTESSDRFRAKYWVNGANTAINEIASASYSYANGICRRSNVTWIIGGVYSSTYYHGSGGRQYPAFALWNASTGTPTTITQSGATVAIYEGNGVAVGPDNILNTSNEAYSVIWVNPDATSGNVGQKQTGVAPFAIRFFGGSMYTAGYLNEEPYPPSYAIELNPYILPDGMLPSSDYVEAQDIYVLDGIVYTCGHEVLDDSWENFGPKLWRGTTLQTVTGWTTSSGGAYAVWAR